MPYTIKQARKSQYYRNVQDADKQKLLKEEHPFPHSNKSDDLDFTLTQYHKDMIYYLHYSDFVEGGYEK